MLQTVAIIGAGPLGRWLAVSAARAGYRVLLEDVMPANLHHAQEYLRQQLGPGFAPGTIGAKRIPGSESPTFPAQALDGGVALVSTIEDAVRQADLVIDCVPDELESKLEILWLLDRMAPPRTVFATPTTRLSIADLANCTYRPDKVIAIAVEASALSAGAASGIELRTTAYTSRETVALVGEFWRRMGFTPTFARDLAEKPGNSVLGNS